MLDIALTRGDFSVSYKGKDAKGNQIFDLDIESGADSIENYVGRCLKTPYSYLRLYEYPSLSYIDNEFGNQVYQYLSELADLNLLSRLSSTTQEALIPTASYIDIIDIRIETRNLYEVEIRLQYRIKDGSDTKTTTIVI